MLFKKILPLLTVIALSTTMMAGCGKGQDSSVNSSGKPGVVSDKAIELSIHLGTMDSGVFKDDWSIFKKAAEITNVNLKGSLPSTVTDFEQAFNLMIASGDIPDIVLTSNVDFFKYGPDGAFEPLDDLIKEHAPNLQKFLDENPDVRQMATGPDGNLWFIPFVQDGEAQSGWFVRQDWLDKLGLQQPKNVDELYNVMKTFIEKDANGNGKRDEVPYFHRDGKIGTYDLLSLWNAYPKFHAVDGKVQYGPLESEYKTAMENITKWYSEGLIDQEIFTRGVKARDILLADNVGGITHDFFGSTGNYNDKLADKIEGFLFKPMTPPANSLGKIVEPTKRAKAKTFGWGISGTNESKVETIKYFDFWFTEEGRRMANFGTEGDTYTMVDGKPIFTDKVLKGEKAAIDIIRETGAQSNFGFQQDYFYEEQWTNKIALEGIKEYVNNGYIAEQYPDVKFTEEEQKEIEKIAPKVDSYLAEVTQQWILGSKPIDHESLKAELKKLGADKLVEINQAAYDRYMKSIKQ